MVESKKIGKGVVAHLLTSMTPIEPWKELDFYFDVGDGPKLKATVVIERTHYDKNPKTFPPYQFECKLTVPGIKKQFSVVGESTDNKQVFNFTSIDSEFYKQIEVCMSL